MSTMILSAKRQVVLPAELCRQIAIAPGAEVRVELAPGGDGILVRPLASAEKKPAAVLFARVSHRGPPVSVDDLQGVAVARKLAAQGKP